MKKNIFYILLCFLALPMLSFGQKKGALEVNQRDELMSLGSRPSYSIRFEKTDDKRVEDLWKDFVKDQFDAKVKRNKKAGEYNASDASASAIHNENFDLYSKIEESGDDVVLTVWFDLGSNFLNAKDNTTASEEVKSYLRAFDRDVERSKAEDRVKEEKKKLDDIGDDLKKLQKKNDGYHEDIKDYEEKIRKAQDEIKNNEAEQDKMRKAIEEQQRLLDIAQKYMDGIGG